VISRPGYELLINQSIEKAQYFAELINENPDFELITAPELCLLTYRYNPRVVQQFLASCPIAEQKKVNLMVDKLTKFIQKRQRENGRSFVSRTRIEVADYQYQKTLVFRVVLANPLTSKTMLADILSEQMQLAGESKSCLPQLLAMVEG
jgi:glutamate decarboxylase